VDTAGFDASAAHAVVSARPPQEPGAGQVGDGLDPATCCGCPRRPRPTASTARPTRRGLPLRHRIRRGHHVVGAGRPRRGPEGRLGPLPGAAGQRRLRRHRRRRIPGAVTPPCSRAAQKARPGRQAVARYSTTGPSPRPTHANAAGLADRPSRPSYMTLLIARDPCRAPGRILSSRRRPLTGLVSPGVGSDQGQANPLSYDLLHFRAWPISG